LSGAWLAEMARRHPELHIQTCYSDRFVDLIAEGYDCAIRVGYLPDSNLVARRVGRIYGKLVTSPAYIEAHGAPVTPQDLATHQSLMQSTESWRFLDGDNAAALVAAAVAGVGIAYLPDWVTDDYVASGALVPIMTRYPPPAAGAYVVRPPGQHPSRNIRVLTELLIETCDR
jgi:DNA-binding transcriptional LysR family regulator